MTPASWPASEAEAVARRFIIEGQPLAVEPFGGGHINDSFLVTQPREGPSARFLLQRINDTVFPAPALVMENIQRVTDHIAQRFESLGVADAHRRLLTLVPTNEGSSCCRDDAGSYWRLYRYIEGSRACQTVETPEQAEQAGQAFGAFHYLLADLPGPRLHDTIPGFHDTPSRFAALERAVQADPHGRAAEAQSEIEYAFLHRSLANALLDVHQAGDIPERIVHNDAKISNVLFDRERWQALCIVDLDTVMPGLALYDVGDMIRSMTCPAAEDETDLSRVEVRMSLFTGLARGYFTATAPFLTQAERDHLVTAGKLITLEQGVRFLTDFLSGDRYYRTQRPNQNLHRCRTQFKLLDSILRNEQQMVRFIARL